MAINEGDFTELTIADIDPAVIAIATGFLNDQRAIARANPRVNGGELQNEKWDPDGYTKDVLRVAQDVMVSLIFSGKMEPNEKVRKWYEEKQKLGNSFC